MEVARIRPGDPAFEASTPPRKRPQIVDVESTTSIDEEEAGPAKNLKSVALFSIL